MKPHVFTIKIISHQSSTMIVLADDIHWRSFISLRNGESGKRGERGMSIKRVSNSSSSAWDQPRTTQLTLLLVLLHLSIISSASSIVLPFLFLSSPLSLCSFPLSVVYIITMTRHCQYENGGEGEEKQRSRGRREV